MIMRIFQTKNLDLATIEFMIHQADKQANFHPDNRWIYHSFDGEIKALILIKASYQESLKSFMSNGLVVRQLLCGFFLTKLILR